MIETFFIVIDNILDRGHGLRFKRYSQLSNDHCSFWAKHTLWSIDEAIKLFIGICPHEADIDCDEQASSDLGYQYYALYERIKRGIIAGDIVYTFNNLNIIWFKPFDITKWAIENSISIPDNVLNAVMEHRNIKVSTEPSLVNNKIDNLLASNCRYRFEKVGKAWNIQLGDVLLNGVKDWAGMIYIKLLLQNPNKQIGVLQLQNLVGTNEDNNYIPVTGYNSGDVCDEQAIQEYRKRLSQIQHDLEVAMNVHNRTRIERLEKEKSDIEAHVKEANYKCKDPDVERVRKLVLKAINDARENIRKLELHLNYNDTPISSHLKRHIRTGKLCSYLPSGENPPYWEF